MLKVASPSRSALLLYVPVLFINWKQRKDYKRAEV